MTSQGATILVVEDEGIVAMDLQRSLTQFGYRVLDPVSSSEEALARVAETSPDLVLMDIRIRGPVDGVETGEMLRARYQVPVVYLTANGDEATIDRAKRTEPLGFLLKPYKPRDLRSTVEIALYRNQMERRLRARERQLAAILQSAGDAILTTDAAGCIEFMNPSAESLTGWPATEAAGQAIADVLRLRPLEPTRELAEHPVLRALREGRPIRLDDELALHTRDGRTRTVGDSVSPIADDGRTLGVVVVLTDVTEQRELRRKAEVNERMVSLGQLAAGVAHEVNNPLTAISTNMRYLSDELATHRPVIEAAVGPEAKGRVAHFLDEVSDIVGDASVAAARIQDIVADLKLFSRPLAPVGDSTPLAPAVAEAVKLTAGEFRYRAALVVELPPECNVAISGTRLVQVFVNLLINAAHAIQEGHAADNSISIIAQVTETGWVEIAVRDTGQGMAPEVRDRIFEPFFTTKQVSMGTGLGLSVCSAIVRGAGGTITVTSEVGLGTEFRVRLPLADRTRLAGVEPEVPGQAEGAAPRGKVLVIDDEVAIRQVIRRILGRHHDVTLCDGAGSALKLLEEGQRFDLILCDVMMPGMTGPELFQRVGMLDPELPGRVAFLSGGAVNAKVADFLSSVANAVVEKPFEPASLRGFVDRFMERRRAQ